MRLGKKFAGFVRDQLISNIIFIFKIEVKSSFGNSCIFHNIGNGCLGKPLSGKEFKGSVVQSTFLSFFI